MYKVNNKKLDGFSMCSKHGKCYSAVVIVINVAIAAANSRSTIDTYTQLRTKQKRLLKSSLLIIPMERYLWIMGTPLLGRKILFYFGKEFSSSKCIFWNIFITIDWCVSCNCWRYALIPFYFQKIYNPAAPLTPRRHPWFSFFSTIQY